MDDNFEISVKYKGNEIMFSATLVATTFTYKIIVNVLNIPIEFERDEENNFRAILNRQDLQRESKIDKDLINEIGNRIEILFND